MAQKPGRKILECEQVPIGRSVAVGLMVGTSESRENGRSAMDGMHAWKSQCLMYLAGNRLSFHGHEIDFSLGWKSIWYKIQEILIYELFATKRV